MMRKTTTTTYFSISIGFVLMIQVLQVELCGSTVDESTENSKNPVLKSMKAFMEDPSLGSDVMNEEKPDASMNYPRISPRTNKQLETDVRTNYNGNGWKTFSMNHQNSISTKTYHKGFSSFNNAPLEPIPDESRVVFPGEQPLYIEPSLDEPICENAVLCENAPNYPMDLIESQLSKNKYLRSFQSRDEIVEVNNRIGNSDDDTLCISQEEVKYPRIGVTRDGRQLFIVNGENYVQAIRVEICKNENGPCRLVNEFASGYRTMCEQKYIYRELLGIGRDGSLAPEYFKIPSSCCCHVKFVGHIWERIGTGFHNYSSKRS